MGTTCERRWLGGSVACSTGSRTEVLLMLSWELWTMAVFRDGDLSSSSEIGEAVHEAAAECRDKEETSEQIETSELTLDILTMLELGLD